MMSHLIKSIHTKLGDFWWYSLLIFVACRAADLLNAFVGLWLVPKYVDPSELGAVMPLTNLSAFIALPISVFASTFRNELTGLVNNNEFGKAKTLMRGVFIAGAIFIILGLIFCQFVMPHFLYRIRIQEGSLTILILFASFVGSIAPIYSNAVQSLKKFKGFSLICLLGAPVRLVTMLITMPFRAISGYFVGQASVPSFSIFAAIVCLRKEFAIKAEPYWNSTVIKRFGKLFILLAISAAASQITALVESTILRQRLPELDSAAYYMVTRFSDIASFLSATLMFTIFPYTAELAAKGKSTRPIVLKTSFVLIVFNAVLAIVFYLFGKQVLTILPHGSEYAEYWWAIPWLIVIGTMTQIQAIHLTAETSANRFGYLLWFVPLTMGYSAAMLCVTGYGYFTGIIPGSWTEFLSQHNITTLSTFIWWMSALAGFKLLFSVIQIFKQK